MRRIGFLMGTVALALIVVSLDSHAQRGGRGGGGRAGGISAGGYRSSGAVAGPYGAGAATRSSGTVVGPGGGTRSVAGGSGSYTTKGGSTIDYGAAGRGGTTPGGINYGRGVGGVQVTTPGGKQVSKVGTAAGAAGPGGRAVGGKAGVTTGTGPGGSFSSAYRGGVAVGPQGKAATGGRVTTATGAAGTATRATRTGAAAGSYGAAAGRTTVARGAGGTYYASRTALASTGTVVRSNFRTFAQQYPGLALRWAGPTWRPIAWGALAGYAGYPAEPVYYDYGETVVYSGDNVTINGTTTVPTEQYVQQAAEIATTGAEAPADPKVGEWQPLGVFAMVGEGEEKSTNLFQLSINKEGVLRGEYYNAITDESSPVKGSVDKKTQRAAWTVGERKFPLYEAGIANLTKNETTMLVHFAKDKSQQYTLVRVEAPQGKTEEGGK